LIGDTPTGRVHHGLGSIENRFSPQVAGTLALAMILSLPVGCGGSTAPGTISGGTLSGKIQGKPWTFVAGAATCHANTCLVSAFPIDFAACSATPEADEFRISSLPNAVGNYDLDATVNASFFGGDSITVYAGRVAVYAVTTSTITVGANVTVDPVGMTRTYVNGKFQVPICP
jgi:hypothetical protein